MRWFFDSEFAEDGETIKPISIGLVSDLGHSYYAIFADTWSLSDCSDWVVQNVVSKLGPQYQDGRLSRAPHDNVFKPKAQIAAEVKELVLKRHTVPEGHHEGPEFWAYYADYDWVVMAQLYGTMLDLPEGFPVFCMDLKQDMVRYGLGSDSLPQADPSKAHNALYDAWWCKQAWDQVQAHATSVIEQAVEQGVRNALARIQARGRQQRP